jgi:hypothetical protein
MFRGGSRSRHPTVSCISGVKRDSTLDAGNNNRINTPVKCNFPPYGRDFPGGVPTGRFSNGKLTSDFVGTSKNPSYISIYAYAGLNNVFLYHLYVL